MSVASEVLRPVSSLGWRGKLSCLFSQGFLIWISGLGKISGERSFFISLLIGIHYFHKTHLKNIRHMKLKYVIYNIIKILMLSLKYLS